MLNWRDLKNPKSGGAEVLTEGILSRLAQKHKITIFCEAFPHGVDEEIINGYQVIRRGSQYTVHLWAFIYWFKQFRHEQFDVIIDQVHGIPFFANIYSRKPRVIVFIHEVAREIWLKMLPFPIGWIGYALERWFFLPLRKLPFITVSESTKADLMSMGVPSSNISITQEAIDDDMHIRLDLSKENDPTLIYVGRLAAMKNPEEVIEAFRLANKKIPELKLWMLGSGDEKYVRRLKEKAGNLPVTFFGFVDGAKKKELLSKAWVLVSASMKEGFGLVPIEAAAQGTPSVVYNVEGFKDSIKHMQTGILCDPTNPGHLAEHIVNLINDKGLYRKLRENAKEYSKQFNFDLASRVFEKLIL